MFSGVVSHSVTQISLKTAFVWGVVVRVHHTQRGSYRVNCGSDEVMRFVGMQRAVRCSPPAASPAHTSAGKAPQRAARPVRYAATGRRSEKRPQVFAGSLTQARRVNTHSPPLGTRRQGPQHDGPPGDTTGCCTQPRGAGFTLRRLTVGWGGVEEMACCTHGQRPAILNAREREIVCVCNANYDL